MVRVTDEQILQWEPLIYRVIGRHFPFVFRRRRSRNSWGRFVDEEDYVQLGRLAVMAAIRDYDPARGMKLMSFIYSRVRFMILSSIDHDSPAKRQFFHDHHLRRANSRFEATIECRSWRENEEEIVDRDETKTLLGHIESQLPERDLSLLRRRANGRTFASIAAEDSVSLEAVRSRFERVNKRAAVAVWRSRRQAAQKRLCQTS